MAMRPGAATVGSIETFGGWNEQNPRKFLRSLQFQMLPTSGITAPDAMAEFFMLCLDADCPVDDWYQTLDPVIRTDWDLLAPEFVREWAQPAARSAIDKTTEPLNTKLKPEESRTLEPWSSSGESGSTRI
jgi:hypothetical protein